MRAGSKEYYNTSSLVGLILGQYIYTEPPVCYTYTVEKLSKQTGKLRPCVSGCYVSLPEVSLINFFQFLSRERIRIGESDALADNIAWDFIWRKTRKGAIKEWSNYRRETTSLEPCIRAQRTNSL